MSLIGTKLSSIVPRDAQVLSTDVIVMKDQSGQPTGRTLVDEFLDADQDQVADLVRHTWKDEGGDAVSVWYSTPPDAPAGEYCAFANRNGDDLIDDHSYSVDAGPSTSTGKPMAIETIGYMDSNFDGLSDSYTRASSNGQTQWMLEDSDFNGIYELETRYVEPSAGDPSGTTTRRDVAIDVQTME